MDDARKLLDQMCVEYESACQRLNWKAGHNFTYRESRKLLAQPINSFGARITVSSTEPENDPTLTTNAALAQPAASAEGVREACIAEISHKAFLCHTHDDFGRGREQGLLDACEALRTTNLSNQQDRTEGFMGEKLLGDLELAEFVLSDKPYVDRDILADIQQLARAVINTTNPPTMSDGTNQDHEGLGITSPKLWGIGMTELRRAAHDRRKKNG